MAAGSDRAFGCERHSESGDWTRSAPPVRSRSGGSAMPRSGLRVSTRRRSGRRAEVYGGDEQTHPDAVGSSAPAGCCAGRCRCPVYLALPACAEDRPCRAQILVREQRSRVRRQGCRRGRANIWRRPRTPSSSASTKSPRSRRWVFDDPRVGLNQEPFVSGADAMIDRVVADVPNADSGFTLVFSSTPFPGHQYQLSVT